MSSRGTTIKIATVAMLGLIMPPLAGNGAHAQQQSILRGIVVDH